MTDSLTANQEAYQTLMNDINHAFMCLEETPFDDAPNICDGDMKLLDAAVKRFKTTVWENQLLD
ncbi:MAG: hypothetical protein CBC89_04840 [Euryarchaeota archaeon TMED129]|nr:MAG: hypothetical protein CBC89_04840 [Euryarchaeota archaeon TMED129]|tara:strand:+ start:138 stop:329 length:192 start_codon:yes stop_codon:yes gene_type:complete